MRRSVPIMRRLANPFIMDSGADVVVRVRGAVVVHVEQTVVQVLVIVTTNVQARIGRVEVPVIAKDTKTRLLYRSPNILFF